MYLDFSDLECPANYLKSTTLCMQILSLFMVITSCINSEKPLWFSPLDFLMVQLYVDLETKFILLD